MLFSVLIISLYILCLNRFSLGFDFSEKCFETPCLSVLEFDRPEVTLCSRQDVKIQLLSILLIHI